MTSFGAFFILAAIVTLFLLRKRGLSWVLAAAIGFPATAALNISATGIVPFYLSAVGAAAAVFLRFAKGERPEANAVQPGRALLLLFLVWTILITAVGPTLFAGVEVLEARGGTDLEIQNPSSLTYTVSNVAQIIYLTLGVTVTHYLARYNGLNPNLPAIGFALGTGLSFVQQASRAAGLPWPTKFFSNSPTTRYIDYTPDGELRFRGVFTEPAQLATFSIVALVFFVAMAAHTRGKLRIGALAFAALSAFNLVESATGTGLLGGVLVFAFAAAFGLYRHIFRNAKLHPGFIVAGLLAGALILAVGSIIFGNMFALLDEKLAGNSYRNRSATALFSLNLAHQVYYVGVGLGSNRPSSFIPMMLSCVGIVGTVLFLAFLARILVAAWKVEQYRPAVYAVAALFITKIIGGSSIHEPLMWLCLGVCAYAAWNPVARGSDEVPLTKSRGRRSSPAQSLSLGSASRSGASF